MFIMRIVLKLDGKLKLISWVEVYIIYDMFLWVYIVYFLDGWFYIESKWSFIYVYCVKIDSFYGMFLCLFFLLWFINCKLLKWVIWFFIMVVVFWSLVVKFLLLLVVIVIRILFGILLSVIILKVIGRVLLYF